MVRGEGQGIVVHSLQRLCTLDIHGCTHAQGVKQEGELFHSGLCGLSGHGLLDVVLIQGLCQLPEGAFCGVPLLLGKTGQVIGKGVGQGLKLLCVGRGWRWNLEAPDQYLAYPLRFFPQPAQRY